MSKVAHVMPRNDAIVHDSAEECVCGPESELVRTATGDGWLYIHHSLDGREPNE